MVAALVTGLFASGFFFIGFGHRWMALAGTGFYTPRKVEYGIRLVMQIRQD